MISLFSINQTIIGGYKTKVYCQNSSIKSAPRGREQANFLQACYLSVFKHPTVAVLELLEPDYHNSIDHNHIELDCLHAANIYKVS